jgi:catechol 2,3-dioxygenase-like lactoylglutathione lyase family enzyme
MTSDTPRLFRLNVEVGDIDRAAAFYSELLGLVARPQMGSRVYLNAGAVTLQVVQVPEPHPAAKALYFAVGDLDALHARAAALDCLSDDNVHGTPAGEPVVRPWGERSFYADDPWGNPLCFVEEGTLYEG